MIVCTIPAKGILSVKNGMNLMDHDFEDIEVKENALILLEGALRSKRKPCMVGTGSMSDPYMPLEEELCRKLEPGVCTTKARFEALKTLRDVGIPTVVWLCSLTV